MNETGKTIEAVIATDIEDAIKNNNKMQNEALIRELHGSLVVVETNRQNLIKRPLDYALRNYALGLIAKQLNITTAKDFKQSLETAYEFQMEALSTQQLTIEKERINLGLLKA